MNRFPAGFVVLLLAFSRFMMLPAFCQDLSLCDVLVLQEVGKAGSGSSVLPILEEIPPDDPRIASFSLLADNEAALFTRTLMKKIFDTPAYVGTPSWPIRKILIQLQKGGNFARTGLVLREGKQETKRENQPFIVLDLKPESLSQLFLHEGAHLVQKILQGAMIPHAEGWSALPHSLFAVSDRSTALSEAYSIHFEAIMAHFSLEPSRQEFYRNLVPKFGNPPEGFSSRIILDLLTFSQKWQRYQAVRDGLAAFQGHFYPGNYLRTQYDPSRDLSRLKYPGQMASSEGVGATFFFWWVVKRAEELGAKNAQGLLQSGLQKAEEELAQSIFEAHKKAGSAATYMDVLKAAMQTFPQQRENLLSIYLNVTHGVMEDIQMVSLWNELYEASILLDGAKAMECFEKMKNSQGKITVDVLQNPDSLAKMVGKQIPLRVRNVFLEMKALSPEPFNLEFDVNGFGDHELKFIPGLEEDDRRRMEKERLLPPFGSFKEFIDRAKIDPRKFGLEEVLTGAR